MTDNSQKPSGYAGQRERLEKLTDEALEKEIKLIEKLLTNAGEYTDLGEHDTSGYLNMRAYTLYKELKELVNDGKALSDAWEKYGEDQRLPGAFNFGEEIAKQQTIDASSTQGMQDETKKVNDLKQQLGIESPHRAYRQDMVKWAKENDTQHAERIKKRAEEIQDHIAKGHIVEDADGVAIPEIHLKTASHKVQEKALVDTWGGEKDKKGNPLLLPQYGLDDHQNKKSGTQKIQKKYIDKHGDQFGDRELGSVAQLDQMCTWIRNNFTDVKTQDDELYDELYILQMINPDLFEAMWMKDTFGRSHQFLELIREVSDRYVLRDNDPDFSCGLFLVQKC